MLKYQLYTIDTETKDLNPIELEASKSVILKELDIKEFNYTIHADFEDMNYNMVHATETHLIFKA